MLGSADNFLLQRLAQIAKIIAIPRHPHDQISVLLRPGLRGAQRLLHGRIHGVVLVVGGGLLFDGRAVHLEDGEVADEVEEGLRREHALEQHFELRLCGGHDRLAVDPLDPGILWLGGVYLFRSDNGGRTFAYADGPLGGPRAFYHLNHPDNHAIVFHPDFDGGLNQTVFVASDGGIARSNDARGRPSSSFCALAGDIEWTNLNNDYATTQFYHGDSAAGGELIVGGSHDNGTNLTRGFESFNDWRTVFLGDGGYVAIDPRDSDVFYVEMQGFPSIYRTDDGGHSFRLETSGITERPELFISPLAMDPSNPDILWTGGQSPWRYNRQSARW